jgi:hypothetical protein
MGHSETVSLSGAPDTSGAKNPLQQIKSTITYLEIATFCGVTGTASQAASMDDDGNSAAATQAAINESQVADLNALIDEVKADKVAFLKVLKIVRLEDLTVDKYKGAVARLEAKRKK